MRANRDLPPPRVIAVDVDGTLHIAGEPNNKAIAWLHERKAEGFRLMLWSMRGEAHARLIAGQMQCLDLFDCIVSKPGFILDDEGWGWIKRTRVVRATARRGRGNLDSPGKDSLQKHSTEVPVTRPEILSASHSTAIVPHG